MLHNIVELEKLLLEPTIRSDFTKLQILLHDEFIEYSSSGRVYNKQEVIASLLHEKSKLLEIISINTKQLSDGCILLTYQLIADHKLHSLRSSIWTFKAHQWELIFHQGTLC